MAFLTAAQLQVVEENSQTSSGYVKLGKQNEGQEYRYRFLGPGILGWEAYQETEGGGVKPIRWQMKPAVLPANIKPDMNGSVEPKFFMAGLVWDYTENAFRILSITQKTLQAKINELSADPDWGDVTQYDVKITRKKKGDKTEYSMNPAPAKAVSASIQEAYESFYCNLEALFDNGDPFKKPSDI